LIGNGDAHAKNFSILKNHEGEWRISPAYDILCTLYYQDVEMALSVSDKTTLWDRETLLVLGEQLGVPDVLAQQVIEHLLAKTERLTIQLDAGGLPFRPDQNHKVTRTLRNRRKRLESKS
jgi:serine/threonine-protein kinase HipA